MNYITFEEAFDKMEQGHICRYKGNDYAIIGTTLIILTNGIDKRSRAVFTSTMYHAKNWRVIK